MNQRSEKRRRDTHRCQVRMDADEWARIKVNAEKAGITPSALMRQLACGYKPKSIVDSKHMVRLIKIMGDLGRLGGLLKLWLTDDYKLVGYSRVQITDILINILHTQQKAEVCINTLTQALQKKSK